MYLQEAFRALDALTEDTFSVSDDGINKLAEFQNNDDLTDEVKVIDPEAETEEDLQDSYVGKVILDCSVCHSKLYKDKEEVELDEEGVMANVGEECPYCYTSDGFKVIGEVAAFGGEEDNADDGNDAGEDDNSDDTEEVVEESLAQSTSKDDIADTKSESSSDTLTEAYEDTDGIMGEKGQKWTEDQLKNYFNSEKDNDPVLKAYNGDGNKWLQDTTKGMKKVTEGIFGLGKKKKPNYFSQEEIDKRLQAQEAEYQAWEKEEKRKERKRGAEIAKDYAKHDEMDRKAKADYERNRYNSIKGSKGSNTGKTGVSYSGGDYYEESLEEAAFSGGVASNGSVDRYARPGGNTSKATFDKLDNKKTKTVKAKDLKPGMVTDTGKITQVKNVGWRNGKPSVEVSYGGVGNGGSYAADVVAADRDYQVMDESKSIKESVNNVNVETDDSIVNVSTDDNGKITVTTEPNAAPAESGDEIIAPVSPETQAEIEGGSFEDAPVEDEFVDMDVDEFDEESFDGLGESYLKKVYENVDSYKTTSVKESNNKIVVEGIIKFKSGKVGKTSFLFEARDCTKTGKVRFVGENMQLAKGKKSFTITGSLNDKKFITESFNYNYRAKNNLGKSSRIYGTIKK